MNHCRQTRKRMAPTVSVIIPTYRHAAYVHEALESVFAQTFVDFEVIVVNDGSPDNTDEVVAPYVKTGRIRYIKQENQGQAAARCCGLAVARGEFIALLDDDDLWPEDKLEWQVRHLREFLNIGLVGGSFEVLHAETGRVSRVDSTPGLVSWTALFDQCPFCSPGQTLVRASLLRQVGAFDQSIWGADDYDMYFRIARCSGIWRSDKVSLRYRVHSNNASKSTERMLANSKRVLDRQFAYLPSDDPEACRRRGMRYLYQYGGRRLALSFHENMAAGRLSRALSDLSGIRHFIPSVFADSCLFYWILKDFAVPLAIRTALNRHLGRKSSFVRR